MTKVNDFKIRSSQSGDIMGYPDKDTLPKGAISFLETWMIEKKFGVQKFEGNKYTEKGNLCEDEAIDLLGLHEDNFYVKNQESKENDYVSGTADIVTDIITDIKCPWDMFSFPIGDQLPNKNYFWQMQCYMWLYDKPSARVVYCLMNTPDHLAYEEKDRYDYSQLDIKDRIKIYTVERDDEAIEQLKNRVELCKNYVYANQ